MCVSPGQIARDHLISHLLAALSAHAADQVVFFGGTALSRTLLPEGRLSEDIDLIARGIRRDVAEHLHRVLPRALRREYPGLRWDPGLPQVREAGPAILHTPEGLTVRVQLLSPVGYPPWPVERVELIQCYRDAAPAGNATSAANSSSPCPPPTRSPPSATTGPRQQDPSPGHRESQPPQAPRRREPAGPVDKVRDREPRALTCHGGLGRQS